MNHSFGAPFATFLKSRDLQRAMREFSSGPWSTHPRPLCRPRAPTAAYKTIVTGRLLKAAFP